MNNFVFEKRKVRTRDIESIFPKVVVQVLDCFESKAGDSMVLRGLRN